MNRWPKTLLLFGAAVTLLAAAAPAAAQSGPASIELVMKLGEVDPEEKRLTHTYRLHAADKEWTRLRIGDRVPIAVSEPLGERSQGDAPGERISYQYQDVGLSLEARPRVEDDGRIRLDVEVETSRILGEGSKTPRIGVLHHAASVLLTPGEPLEIARADDARDWLFLLEIEANIVD